MFPPAGVHAAPAPPGHRLEAQTASQGEITVRSGMRTTSRSRGGIFDPMTLWVLFLISQGRPPPPSRHAAGSDRLHLATIDWELM